MNKPIFETQVEVVKESELRSINPATDFSPSLRPLQELSLKELSGVGGGLSPMIF